MPTQPPASTGVTPTPTSPPPAAETPKKPAPTPPTPERFGAILARVDAVLVALTVALAFLLGSFVAMNSDLLQHLAVGRLIANGDYDFGVDPFTYTTEAVPGSSDRVYWANHSWLFGLVSYGVYKMPAGGIELVLLKCLVLVVMTIVMLRTSHRPGERWWMAAAMTTLAILTASPRFLLQPTILSFLFLAITLRLLTRPVPQPPLLPTRKKGKPGSEVPFKTYLGLPILCMLWVNVDAWFFLGPLTIGLYALGLVLQEKFLPVSNESVSMVESPRTIGLVALVSLAACLINPHHIHAFVLPAQLGIGEAAQTLSKDPLFASIFLSPLSPGDDKTPAYFATGIGYSAAGFAYLVLLLAGVVSFVLTVGSWRFWRVTVWLAFTALSLYHARAIPFFAVVAGPITALNFLDYAAIRVGPTLQVTGPWAHWSRNGRALTFLGLLVLIGLTIPGWTQAKPYSYRRVGLGVHIEPSLQRAREQIKEWRASGQLPPNARLFNTTPDVVNYLAWFAPGEKGFLDHRIGLFDRVAKDYSLTHEALTEKFKDFSTDEKVKPPAWREIFPRYEIGLIVCYETDLSRNVRAIVRLLVDPKEWGRLHAYGRTAIYAWKNPTAKGVPYPYAALEQNDDRLAFGPRATRAARTPRTRARAAQVVRSVLARR